MTELSPQEQTEEAFSFKWKRRDTYESKAMQSEWRRWLFEKYFDGQESRLQEILESTNHRLRILDAGCGSGSSALLLFGDALRKHDYLGIDISDAVELAKMRFAEAAMPGEFQQLDIKDLSAGFGKFDLILSEGVLHHTDSVRDGIKTLSSRLTEYGFLMFYVYSKKAPIREFVDDFVRAKLSNLSDTEAWDALLPLTELGKSIGKLDVEIEIHQDITFLGIESGTHNLQRLLYYHFFKAYYRPDFSLDEMNHINFDWYRPKNCHRHTPEEISEYCSESGLSIQRLHVEESGITVIAQKLGLF